MGYDLDFSLDAVEELFEDLGAKAYGISARALYEGAGHIADELSGAVDAIRTEPFHYVTSGEKKRLPSPQEKEALKSGKMGIAKFKKSWDAVETSVGLGNSGYVHIMGTDSSKYNKGKGKAAAQIAHAIDHGTSFMQAQPFLKNTFARTRAAALEVIEAYADKELQGIIDAHE